MPFLFYDLDALFAGDSVFIHSAYANWINYGPWVGKNMAANKFKSPAKFIALIYWKTMHAELNSSNGANPERLAVMNFLNEMAGNYPAVISFASGRPAEEFFDVPHWLACIPLYEQYFAAARGLSPQAAQRVLAQYGPTAGIINELIARQVGLDEHIQCKAGDVLVTSGCQEAIELCVRHLCPAPDDVLLVRSPTYIGITGVADLHGIHIAPFSSAPGAMAAGLEAAIQQAKERGQRPRALYLVPEFDNPTGTVIGLEERRAVLAVCARHRVMILEDNPYGMFRFEGESVPSFYSLDSHGCVVYLGTYSKTICPAVRIGFAILPSGSAMLSSLSQAKSFVTVNTSQIMQAMVGGFLLDQDGSLRRHVQPAIAHYRHNRDTMLDALERAFAGCDGVSWNRPEGGFFLVVRLPMAFGMAEAETCARDHGVLVMPLRFFSHDAQQDRCVRLAFSNNDPMRTEEGVQRFARFVRQRLGR
jgi:(S)-3,5-dihydroxyphenylglycine transaminase